MSIDALILAGGRGTRLQETVIDAPKSIVDINGRPFITYQFDQLIKAGIERVIVSTGYLSVKITETIGNEYKNLDVIYSNESIPLGTGGGIRKALTLIKSKTVLVMNGDSYVNTHLDKFINWYEKNDYEGSLLITDSKNENRYGNIKVSSNGRIKKFSEKERNFSGRSLISTGYYLFSRKLIGEIPKPFNKPVSLEYDCFPFWIDDGLGGYYRRAKFIDIGTPETLEEAKKFFKRKKRK